MFLRELISQGWQALMRDRTRSADTEAKAPDGLRKQGGQKNENRRDQKA